MIKPVVICWLFTSFVHLVSAITLSLLTLWLWSSYAHVLLFMLFTLVCFAFMLGCILISWSLLQKCMLLLTTENCCNLLICHICCILWVHLMSMISTCFRSMFMPYLQGCNPCIFIYPVVSASSLWSGPLAVNFLSMLKLLYHVAMFDWCYELIHA
mgnify:CR=1 FL=1